MNNQTLYIMCGLAFSGKSTLVKKIAEYTGSKLIAFDKLWVKKDKEHLVPKGVEGWKFIRKVSQDEIAKALQKGLSVVYDENNIRFEHREELRNVAKKFGVTAVVVYLNTPLELIREREALNKNTQQRHEVASENFNAVLDQLQIPTIQENVRKFKPEYNLSEWIKINLMNEIL